MINKESILLFFREKTRKPLGYKDIVSLMRLSHPEARALRRLLRQMVREGHMVMTRKGLYGPSEDMNLVTGDFEAHRDGYGFVIPEKPGERDIFVPARWTMGAMNHDRVVVRMERWQRREGRVVRILDRASARIVGRLDITKTASFVRPMHKAASFDLFVPAQERGDARDGDKVVAEITSFPTDTRPPSARVIKVMRKPEDPKADIEAIIEEFNLPRKIPRQVHDESKLLAQRTFPGATSKRKDLTSLPTVTIDGERAKDFDDAVSIALTEHGYRLWVHIADVGSYVGWNSAMDLEARRRGTSIYFPDRVIPMLPKELSEDLCSLNPGVERFSFTVEMEYDRRGERVSKKFYPSVIKSDERMTYTSVRKILVDEDRHERERYGSLLRDFELMNELSGILRGRRLERGSLDFDLPEPEVLLDLQGMPEAITRAERNLAHMMIEEFMIAANEAVAEEIESLGVPCLYRIHEEPDPLKLEDIARAVRPMVRLRRKPLEPEDLPRLLADIRGVPGEEVIHYMILRSLKQARYSAVNAGHFGLSSKCYTHFTSPIRRYPDLVVHRILREVLTKNHLSDKRIKELEGLLPEVAFHSSRMERRADDAEREVLDAMRVWFMKDRVGEEYEGMVVGVSPYGLKLRLREFYVEGFIHVSYMTDDFYRYDERAIALSGRHTGRSYRIGDAVKVRVDNVDMEEREILFGMLPQPSKRK